MNNEFFSYYYLNEYIGSRSIAGTVEHSYMMQFFMRALFQRALSVIKFDLPAAWDKKYFKAVLFSSGFIPIIKLPEYGIIPQRGQISSQRGIFHNPVEIIIDNELVKYRGRIGKDCELVVLSPDYCGIWDLIQHYALMMTEQQTTISTSQKNSRVSFLMAAKDRAAAETLKIIAEKISAGETAIVYDKRLKEDLGDDTPIFDRAYDARQAYIVTQALADMDSILSMFDREIGIPSINDKRERYIESEVEAITADSAARLNTWTECLRESINKVNAFYYDGDPIIKFHTIKEEAHNNGNPKANTDRTLQL